MRIDGQIAFVELPSPDIEGMRRFYGRAFGWPAPGRDAERDRGPVEPLVVFYVRDLEAARARVLAAGGEIVREIFAVPGGRRFHFRDPGENEVAVWSDAPVRRAAAALPAAFSGARRLVRAA